MIVACDGPGALALFGGIVVYGAAVLVGLTVLVLIGVGGVWIVKSVMEWLEKMEGS